MKKLPLIARLLLGSMFFVFGLNGFLQFIPAPPMPEQAVPFVTGLAGSGYFLPFLKGVEVICGALLLIGAFVPLALIVLAPIIINIFLFHFFLAPDGLAMAVVIGILEIYLAFFADPYRAIVKQIFQCPMKKSILTKKVK